MKLICLVDNAVQPFSPYWGEHGLAFLIETGGQRLLFDTGASGTVLLHNLQATKIPPDHIAALALSHAHADHTGGLSAFLEQRPGLPLYAHSDLLQERFSRREGQVKKIGPPMSPEALLHTADLRLSAEPQEALPGAWTTGEITARNEPEGRSPHHLVRQGEGYVPDPYRDDMSLVLEGRSGLVLVCGCCHAGLLNTLAQVRAAFGRDPVAVVGGTHLMGASAGHLSRLVEVLERIGPPAIYPNHCTGHAAMIALAQAFGSCVAPCPAGTTLEF